MQPAVGLPLLVVFIALASTSFGAQLQQRPSAAEGLPEVIPLPLLLGNSKYRNPQLSTSGKYLAYVRPDSTHNVPNIFLQELPTGAQKNTLNRSSSLLEQRAAFDRQVTFDDKRGVFAYSWAEDDSVIFYLQDTNGDENNHLFMVPVQSLLSSNTSSSSGEKHAAPAAVDLTPFPGVKTQGIITSERFPRQVFFSMNKRDPSVYDLYLFDMDTNEIRLHTVNPGDVSSWLVDYDFQLRGVENYNNTDGSTSVQINDALPIGTGQPDGTPSTTTSSSNPAIQAEKGAKAASAASSNASLVPGLFAAAEAGNWTLEQWIAASSTGYHVRKWRLLITWPFGEESSVYRFNARGDGLYATTSLGRDTAELVLFSTAPGAKILKHLASSPLANINMALFHPKTWEPEMASSNYLRPQPIFLDDGMKAMWEKLRDFQPTRDPSIVGRTYDSDLFIISYNADNMTTAQYLYKPGTWPPQLLLEMQPDLGKYQLAAMHSVVIKARDGLKLPAYLTLPRKPNMPTVLPACVIGDVPDMKPELKRAVEASELKCPLNLRLPLVLFVHGGPWARDTWGADSVVQLLANRGYAVLQVNYRGSTGYGKRFYNLGNRQWGVGTMQHDLTDGVRWAIEKGIADPAKVCIFGASYGGYATLAGLTFTPELYACGVDLVGVSNVATFFKSIPPYWRPLRIDLVNRVGDAEANETLNQEISPLYHVRNIRAPLLMGQGANDPRVKKAESDQMFAAMQKKGLDVKYVLYPDEGHGLVRPDNRLDFYSRAEQFLSKHLGGRAAPQLQLPKSSAQVITRV